MTSYVDGNEKVFLLDDNDELVDKYDYPTASGYWVLDGKTFVTIDIADIPTTDGLIVFVASDRRGVVKLPTKSVYRPYANLTFQQVSNQVVAVVAQPASIAIIKTVKTLMPFYPHYSIQVIQPHPRRLPYKQTQSTLTPARALTSCAGSG